MLARFRAALGLVTLSIFLIALTGGARHAVGTPPIRQLIDAVQRHQTGRTDERVPLGDTHDAIDELTTLFNAMLDRIEGLVDRRCGARSTTCRTICARR